MKKFFVPCLCLMFVLVLTQVSLAHFGVIMPDKSMVMQGVSPKLELTLAFCHPFEQNGMVMAKPKAFMVQSGKDKTDLLKSLQETRVLNNQAWKTSYTLKKPGVYAFYFDPQPYWEGAENKYIIHQTKTYVAAFGGEEDWDQEVGLKAEIIPLTRPFGLYAECVAGHIQIQRQAGCRCRCGSGILERREEGDRCAIPALRGEFLNLATFFRC